ncbi:glutamyl-tRNA synthetase [Nematocida homosporus]|uniref:glutamyl-tRNA synthetase n=1 Tax=Nematocida homosporus TaxID=1912981 RepID=UPI00221FF67D|nr:glutamyl-tRNA synthetase [Nematocida homosporus]KAI5186246.1 glutamyl-tRNA synthetase [Nematocida homosporus]
MVTILCNFGQRSYLIPFALSKYVKGIQIEPTNKKHSGGFCNFTSLGEFLKEIPDAAELLKDLPFLASWKVCMVYNELVDTLPQLEKLDLFALPKKERVLIFVLLHTEMIFVNLYKAKKLGNFPNVGAFYASMLTEEDELLKEHNRARKTEVKATDQASFDIGLPADFKVVTRFPPEPSGYLHIGHAKAALLNQYFADRYDGSLIIRMDDTNPSKEKEEYEKSIMEDLSLLGITKYRTTHSSDYFDMLLLKAKDLIRKGLAYCDNTPVEEMRSNRDKGIPAPRRDSSIEDNLRIFEGMISSNEYDTYCLRAKISVDNLNKAMRDPVIYRTNYTPHHRTGTKYKVYPTYDFACPILDSIEGVTLTLRTNEYRDRNPQYMWFISALELTNRPVIWDFSRLNFKHTVLSKRKLRWFVEHEKVSGWDDPRMPTVRGILRKGLSKEALKHFIIMQGPSKNTVLQTWDKLWALNAQEIDPTAKRLHGIEKDAVLKITLSGVNMRTIEAEDREPRTLPTEILVAKTDIGHLQINSEFVLLGVGSFKITSTNPLVAMETHTAPKNVKVKVTWVPANSYVEAKTVEYFDLITAEKPEDQEPHELFNEESKKEGTILCDERLLTVRPKDFIQIEKRGFFYCDSAKPFTLHLVPGTRQNKK